MDTRLIINIKDINDPRIKAFRSLKSPKMLSDNNESILIEGERVFRALLNSKLKIHTIFTLPEFYQKFQLELSGRIDSTTQLFTSSRDLMDEVIGFKMHKGILALAEHPGYYPLEEMGSRIVALNGIIDSENVGSIVRNASAFGINDIVFDSISSSPYLRRPVRVSAGAILNMKVNKSFDLPKSLDSLRQIGYSVYSAELDERSVVMDSFIPSEKFIIVFGSEGHGIDKRILDMSDSIIKIDISNSVQSLNVANSAAIILYEITKKRLHQ